MSMLSKQCKELRAEAERIGYWSPTASRLMFDAADILWSLRNKNVALLGENESLQAENAKLRERVHELEIEYDGATTAVLEKTERIEWIAGRLRGETNENEKLRELVRDMYAAFVHGSCYRWCEFKEPCNYISDGKCQWYDRMAELGTEVVE